MSSTAADVALSSASSSAASSRMSRAPPSRQILALSSGGMEFSSPPSCRPRRGPSGRTLPLPCGSSPPSRPRWPAAGCRRPRPNGSRPPRPLRNSARASLPFPHTQGTVRPETALCPRRDRSRSCPAEGGLKEAGKLRPPLWRNRYRNRRHPEGPYAGSVQFPSRRPWSGPAGRGFCERCPACFPSSPSKTLRSIEPIH